MNNWTVYTHARLGPDAREALFRRIWDLYYRRLYFFIYQYIGDHSEDALQDIMLKVYKNLHRYRPWYAFSTWIYTIARNHCINLVSRKKTRSLALSGNMAQPDADPEAELIRRETGARIDRYLDLQKPAYRQMAYLRFYEGMPLRRIAAAVGIPLGSVKSRLHLMKKELKNILEKENEI